MVFYSSAITMMHGPINIRGTIDLYQRHCGREVNHTNDLHAVPRLRMRGAIPHAPHVFTVWCFSPQYFHPLT